MNYQKHYDILCERAKNRKLECYTERHHIIPKCLGGSDALNNLVNLTPEEHYVAHQLLVKMYPTHRGLVWAAIQMTGQPNGKRNNNKMYGWLRRKYQKISKQRTGKKNGSYGKVWYYNPNTLENIKCIPEDVPDGFVKGRKMQSDKPNTLCQTCNIDTGSKKAKYCKLHRVYNPSLKVSDENFIKALTESSSIRQALLKIGLAAKGNNYIKAKELIIKNNIPLKLKPGRPKLGS